MYLLKNIITLENEYSQVCLGPSYVAGTPNILLKVAGKEEIWISHGIRKIDLNSSPHCFPRKTAPLPARTAISLSREKDWDNRVSVFFLSAHTSSQVWEAGSLRKMACCTYILKPHYDHNPSSQKAVFSQLRNHPIMVVTGSLTLKPHIHMDVR